MKSSNNRVIGLQNFTLNFQLLLFSFCFTNLYSYPKTLWFEPQSNIFNCPLDIYPWVLRQLKPTNQNWTPIPFSHRMATSFIQSVLAIGTAISQDIHSEVVLDVPLFLTLFLWWGTFLEWWSVLKLQQWPSVFWICTFGLAFFESPRWLKWWEESFGYSSYSPNQLQQHNCGSWKA